MAQAGPFLEIGVDTGGTFTDCVVLDSRTQPISGFKVLSTPHDPSIAIFTALQFLFDNAGIDARDVRIILHATTVATNALIERKGSKVGLITTNGFRDIVELRRETRYDEVDLFPKFPDPLVERHLRLGVVERIHSNGNVVTALDENHLRSQFEKLQKEGR